LGAHDVVLWIPFPNKNTFMHTESDCAGGGLASWQVLGALWGWVLGWVCGVWGGGCVVAWAGIGGRTLFFDSAE
jgi:hypothetical protein